MELENDKCSFLVEHLPDPFAYHQMITDSGNNPVDYIFLDVNPAYEKMTGLSRKKLIGQRVTDVYSNIENNSFDWIGSCGRVALTCETAHFEQYFEHLDRWYDITAYSDEPGYVALIFRDITNQKHRENTLVNNIMDITDHKKAEESLKSHNNLLEGIINGTPDVLAIQNPDFTIVRYNKAGYQMLGKTPEELKNKKCYELLGRSQRCDQCATHRALQTKKIEQSEHYFPELGIYLDCRSNPIFDEEGNIIQIIEQLRDITEQKRMEEKLKESEERFRYIAEFSPLPLAIIDSKGNYEYVNPKFTEVFGYTKTDIPTGKRWFERAYPDPRYRQQVIETWENDFEGIAKDVAVPRTFTVTCKHGLEKEVLFRTVLMDNSKYLITYEDITERKEIEESMQYQVQYEQMTADISRYFVTVSPEKIDDAIQYTLERTGQFFNVDRSYVFLFSEDGQYMNNTHEWCRTGIKPQKETLQNVPVSTMPWWYQRIKQFMPFYISDIDNLPDEAVLEKEEFQRQDIQSLLCIPMTPNGVLKGFLGFDSVKEKKEWPSKQLALLHVITETMAVALERKITSQKLVNYTRELEQLYHQLNQEIDKARQVHERSFLTTLPAVEGISMAAHFQPAAKMGGDFYSVIHSNGKLVLYLSDVSGHGLDGTLVSVFIKEAIDSYVSLKQDELSPGGILKHLDGQYRQENYPEELFICIFLAVLDLKTMELSYCGAGFQDTPMVRLGSGEQFELVSEGLFISQNFPIEAMSFQEKTVNLTPGSTVLFTTDGLTEQGSPGAYYRDRLPRVFYENAHLPPHLITRAVNEDFRRFNNGSLEGDDDITFLVLQVDPPDKKRCHLELASSFSELERMKEEIWDLLAPNSEKDLTVLFCLYELAANAMEHGNRLDPGKTVFVEINVTDEYIQACVEDQGEGFNWREAIDNTLDLSGNRE